MRPAEFLHLRGAVKFKRNIASLTMPELPEVEVTRRAIEPHVVGRRITGIIVRNRAMRWPIPASIARRIRGLEVKRVLRRGKYLLLDCGGGWLILHLGMSGSLRVVRDSEPPRAHDHVDLVIDGTTLRLRDPRRFGALLWQQGDVFSHRLLADLGVEPLSEEFTTQALYAATRGRSASIKQLLMNHTIVVGIGNIYANESLFRAGIRPGARAGRLSRERCARLVQSVRETLLAAIAAGGSSLRDFVHVGGEPGYFQQQYFVYARAGLPCRVCGAPVRGARLGQRSAFFCPKCQG